MSSASRILDRYLVEVANAVNNVARDVESLPDDLTQQDAGVISAILFGTPKPSAENVASLVNYMRRQMPIDNLSSDILNAVSVTKFGLDKHVYRAQEDMKELLNYIHTLPVPGKSSRRRFFCHTSEALSLYKMRDRHDVDIGLCVTGDPILNKEKYEYSATTFSPNTDATKQFDEEAAKKTLLDMFSLLHIEIADIDSLIKITKLRAINTALAWADSIEIQLSSNLLPNQSLPQTLTEVHLSSAEEEIQYLFNLLRTTFFRSAASQLTRVEDVNCLQHSTNKCVALIYNNALERMLTALLFYSCFTIEASPKEMIAQEGGAIKKKKIR